MPKKTVNDQIKAEILKKVNKKTKKYFQEAIVKNDQEKAKNMLLELDNL